MLPKELVKVESSVTKIKYKNELNNSFHYIFNVDITPELAVYASGFNKHLMTLKGFSEHDIKVGDMISANGYLKREEYNGITSLVLEFKKLHKSLIITEKGFINFLKTFKGLGPKKIDKIVDIYKEDIPNSKKRFLLNVKNNDELIIKTLGKKLHENLIIQTEDMGDELLEDEEIEFIHEFNIPKGIANKLKKQGKNVYDEFKKNPYQIAFNVNGIGYKSIDNILKENANRGGEISDASPQSLLNFSAKIMKYFNLKEEDFQDMKLAAGIYYVLLEAKKDGHAFLRYNGIKYFLKQLKLEDIDEKQFTKVVENLTETKRVVEEENRYYLKNNYDNEVLLANIIAQRMKIKSVDLNRNDFTFDEGFIPSKEQKDAIKTALNSNIMVLTGGPGTGKTTIAKYIYQELSKNNLDIKVMAPTGTAARRISQVVNCKATTIHRGIGSNGFKVLYNQNNTLKADVVLIDESSMIDLKLAKDLLLALKPQTKIIFIGDVEQLPPVGVGSFLEDLQKANVKTVRLSRVYRQKESNPIVDFAYDVNKKKVNYMGYLTRKFIFDKKLNIFIKKNFSKKENEEYYSFFMQEAVIETALEYIDRYKNILEVQVLTQLRKGGNNSANSINKEIQKLINTNEFIPETPFKVGDKILQIRNNKIKEIFNGSIGIIKKYNKGSETIDIDFIDGDDYFRVTYNRNSGGINENILKNLDLAYAMTIHKSQGQEFKAIVLVVNNYFFINKKMIYTGITRAREKATIVTNHVNLTHGIKTEYGLKEIEGKLKEVKRNSTLSNKIIEFLKEKETDLKEKLKTYFDSKE